MLSILITFVATPQQPPDTPKKKDLKRKIGNLQKRIKRTNNKKDKKAKKIDFKLEAALSCIKQYLLLR